MKVTRIYTGDDGEAHFEDLEVPLKGGRFFAFSELVATGGVMFCETPNDMVLDFHPVPRRQLVVTLFGTTEVECGDGTTRRLGPGDVLLAADTTGRGHITRDLGGPWRSLFIPLLDDFDPAPWRATAATTG